MKRKARIPWPVMALLGIVGAVGAQETASEPKGRALALKPAQVTARAWESKARGGWGDFPPEKVADGDLSDRSSWRAEGRGQWIRFDLEFEQSLTGIDIAFMNGAHRVYRFSLDVSADGEKWTEVKRCESDGRTAGFEAFALNGIRARFVRIVGHGNSNDRFPEWISINEVRLRVVDR